MPAPSSADTTMTTMSGVELVTIQFTSTSSRLRIAKTATSPPRPSAAPSRRCSLLGVLRPLVSAGCSWVTLGAMRHAAGGAGPHPRRVTSIRCRGAPPSPDRARGAGRRAAHDPRPDHVAVAESSAGGLVSAALLAVPGASAYYRGGVVIYTLDGAKAILGGATDLDPGGPRRVRAVRALARRLDRGEARRGLGAVRRPVRRAEGEPVRRPGRARMARGRRPRRAG